jgi:hypothetical protein
MLFVPGGENVFGFVSSSTAGTRPATTTQGTQVTPGTVAFGSYAAIGVALTEDSYGILIGINNNSANNASRRTVVNIGVDYTGSTAFTTIIPNLVGGGAPSYTTEGTAQYYYFPILIPSGSRIGAQAYGSVGTAFRVFTQTYRRPLNPSARRSAAYAESIGESTFEGTNFTPSVTAANGTWTLLGTTNHDLWWWQVGVQGTSGDTSYAANTTILVDVGVGDGTVAGTEIILKDMTIRQGNSAETFNNFPLFGTCEHPVPSGSSIYIRGQNSGANETGNYNAVVVAAGG